MAEQAKARLPKSNQLIPVSGAGVLIWVGWKTQGATGVNNNKSYRFSKLFARISGTGFYIVKFIVMIIGAISDK